MHIFLFALAFAVPALHGFEIQTILKKHSLHRQPQGVPRNYNAPVSGDERKDIDFIVKTLADKPLTKLLSYKSSLDAAGDRIHHIHPLKFLTVVFTDDSLKVGIRNIRKKGWVWKDFSGGLIESLRTEASLGNMNDDFVNDFCKKVGISTSQIQSPIKQGKWVEFIDVLINNVPRSGDAKRYDM